MPRRVRIGSRRYIDLCRGSLVAKQYWKAALKVLLTFQERNTEKNEQEETIIQNKDSHVDNGEPSTINKEDNFIRKKPIHTEHTYSNSNVCTPKNNKSNLKKKNPPNSTEENPQTRKNPNTFAVSYILSPLCIVYIILYHKITILNLLFRRFSMQEMAVKTVSNVKGDLNFYKQVNLEKKIGSYFKLYAYFFPV